MGHPTNVQCTKYQSVLVIKNELIQKPEDNDIAYNFSKPVEDLDLVGEGQAIVINSRIFKDRIKNGFYVEAGAFDGEHASNSLYYEMVHGWKGLLVEPNPDAYQEMISKVKTFSFTMLQKLSKCEVKT